MSILIDIFLPWIALRWAREDNRQLAFDAEAAGQALRHLKGQLDDTRHNERMLQLEILRLRSLIAEAHFRDPHTGRLNPKGILPGQLR